MSQPVWEYVANLGDASPLEYGGLFVYRDSTGVYPPEMELLEVDEEMLSEIEDDQSERESIVDDARERALPIAQLEDVEEREPYTTRRVILEKCTYINGVLSENEFHPDSCAWFATTPEKRAARPQDGNGLQDVANSMDYPVDELIADLCSDDILRRASAWRAVYDYHGWNNGDDYPNTYTRAEVEERYSEELNAKR